MTQEVVPVLPAAEEGAPRALEPLVRVRRRKRKRTWPMKFLGAFALLGIAFGDDGPIDPGLDGLARALSKATGTEVVADDIRWEPSGSALSELVRGRNVLFLGKTSAGTRDVFRARVRLSWEGHPLGITGTFNLTSTPLGDDHALVVRDHYAAFATAAFGQEQSVSLFDLTPPDDGSESDGFGARTMRVLTSLQETGDAAGLKRVDVTLDPPGKKVGLALDPQALRIDVAEERGRTTATLGLANMETSGGAAHMKVEVASHSPKRFVHWAVDTVRAVSWIGPAPIAWLEERVFALKDDARRAAFWIHGSADEVRSDIAAREAAPVLESALASQDDEPWPPPAITPIWKTPEAGEGEWVAAKVPWIKRLEVPGAPAAFVRTFVRPDQERPYSRVLLVAMDMRRLDLNMEAGSEDPKPLVGPAGPGRLPRDPAISTKVVAAFNGAFKTEHGFHGMMVNKRVLLPPVPGAATVILLADGRAGFGSWGASKEITGVSGVPDADIVSLRQNLDPLVDRGVVNPSKRGLWGFTLPGTSMQTERSGVCVTAPGHVLYAWGDDVSGIVLAKAMKMAGCTYGMHLDMNPHHTGFLFANIDDLKGRKYRTELLSTDMEIPNDRYLEHSAKDFFYVTVRDGTPPSAGKSTWAAAKSAQPAPAWYPGLYETDFSPPSGAATVQLFDVEADRAAFRIRKGGHEPDAGTGAASTAQSLEPADAKRVLFALGMGVAHAKRPRGLAVQGRALAPIRASAGNALLVSRNGVLSIERVEDAQTLAPEIDLVELPLLFSGKETFTSSAVVPLNPDAHRTALGITSTGRVIVARVGATGGDLALAEALRGAGCTRAVRLDRGEDATGLFDRSATPTPPRASYDETVIYAIAKPLRPRAFRFEAEAPVAAAK